MQKTYWGLPWWNHKFVLLTFFVRGGNGFDRGEIDFVEGHRWTGKIVQLLPIFEISCTRTGPLKYADVDLRALREGVPENSVRIMGHTVRYGKNYDSERIPGVNVFILGPGGKTIATSDHDGLFDVTGLPPGAYYIDGTVPNTSRGFPVCYWDGSRSLKAGDVRECEVPQ